MALYINPPDHHKVPQNQKHIPPAALHSRSPSMDSKMHPGSNSSRSLLTHEQTRSVGQGSSSSILLHQSTTTTPLSERKLVSERLVAQATGSQERFTQEHPTGTQGRLDLDTSLPIASTPPAPQSGVSNAYYLKLEMSGQVAPGTTAHLSSLKHKPTLNLPRLVTGFTDDLNGPISQRSPSENSPWPYDPSSYYNIARSPTAGTYPKPKAYPLGWEEGGGLTRPVSIAGIDLSIPLSPMPMVPTIPEAYKSTVPVARHSETGQRVVVYGHERGENAGQVSGKTILNQQEKKKSQRTEQQQTVIATIPKTQHQHEYTPQVSPLEYLVELWELAAHGKFLSHRVQPKKPVVPKSQQLEMPEGVFVLNMFRGTPPSGQQSEFYGFTPEHFSFGPTPFDPFYIIQATPDALYPDDPMDINPNDPATFFNDIVIMRRNPVTHTDTSVLIMALNPQAATTQQHFAAASKQSQPPNQSPTQGDELITLIFPKQAVMMALDSSANHVDENGRHDGEYAQTLAREAVGRAAETECCKLSWDEARGRYYLYHPGIGHGGEVYLVIVDDGNPANSEKPAKRSPGAGFGVPGAKGSIKLINVDTSEAIVVLDFNSGLLFVNTVATRKIPSLYIVDVAVSTVLAVAVVEGRRIRAQQKLLSSSTPLSDKPNNNYLYQSQSYGGASQVVKYEATKSGKSGSTLYSE